MTLRNDSVPKALGDLLENSAVPLVLADTALEDMPLVAVNDRFSEMSGYARDEILDRNCRFLQPEGGAGPVRARMRAFFADPDRQSDRFLLSNVRKSGTPFLNLLFMAKINVKGGTNLILGSQFDVTQRQLMSPQAYDAALGSDIRRINSLIRGNGMAAISTFATLASSIEVLAKVKINE